MLLPPGFALGLCFLCCVAFVCYFCYFCYCCVVLHCVALRCVALCCDVLCCVVLCCACLLRRVDLLHALLNASGLVTFTTNFYLRVAQSIRLLVSACVTVVVAIQNVLYVIRVFVKHL